MQSINIAIIKGRLGGKPEIRTKQNGNKVANISIATAQSWKDKTTDEWQERVQWHRVVILSDPLINKVIDPMISQGVLDKGAYVFVQGAMETRDYIDQETGKKSYITELVLRPFSGEFRIIEGAQSRNAQNIVQNHYDPLGSAPADDELPL